MNTTYKTICGIVCAATLGGCTSGPRVAQFDYVRPDQCLCKTYGTACKYHTPNKDNDSDESQQTLIAATHR